MRQSIAIIEQGGTVAGTLDSLAAGLVAAGFSSVDYAQLCNADTLAPLAELDGTPARLIVAARIGGTRLIDNMAA